MQIQKCCSRAVRLVDEKGAVIVFETMRRDVSCWIAICYLKTLTDDVDDEAAAWRIQAKHIKSNEK